MEYTDGNNLKREKINYIIGKCKNSIIEYITSL